jgi:hypothetical protein
MAISFDKYHRFQVLVLQLVLMIKLLKFGQHNFNKYLIFLDIHHLYSLSKSNNWGLIIRLVMTNLSKYGKIKK